MKLELTCPRCDHETLLSGQEKVYVCKRCNCVFELGFNIIIKGKDYDSKEDE